MSFWKTSDGQQVEAEKEIDQSVNMEPMPEGTVVIAMIEESGWNQGEFDEFENLRNQWTVLEGEFQNRKIFQKLQVRHDDPKKRDRAVRMLAAIDANFGGKLMAMGQEPSDMDLMTNLCNKPLALKLGVWEGNDGGRGNWIMAVCPVGSATPTPPRTAAQKAQDAARAQARPKRQPQQSQLSHQQTQQNAAMFDDDIPF